MSMRRLIIPALLSLLASSAAFAAAYEAPQTLTPAEVLPAATAKGDHFEVVAPVSNDGFMNTYQLVTDYGRFDAEGRVLLEIRIQEVSAFAALAELSKSKVFVDAVGEGLKTATVGQIETVQKFAEAPVDTVKAIPGGVARLFRRVSAQAGDAVSSMKKSNGDGTTSEAQAVTDKAVDAGTAYAKKYLGVSKAERLWAQKLGVDPYTSNAPLKKQIESVARVDAIGRFSVRLAGLPSIPGVNYVRKTNELVWGTDPYELKMMNQKKLAQTGASADEVAKLLNNSWLSPTRQTYITQALDGLQGVADRGLLVTQGAAVDSEVTGYFFGLSLQMLAWRHTHGSPLVRILMGRAAPLGLTADGTVVAMAATDYVTWNETLDQAVQHLRHLEAVHAKAYEVGFLGQVSPRALAELHRLGFRVTENLGKQLDATLAKP